MEASIRLAAFVSIFVIVAIVEWRFPARERAQSRAERWPTNVAIFALDVLVQRVTLGAVAYLAAIEAEARGFGLFHLIAWPGLVEAALGLLVLDLAVYLQHVASHKIPWFWRLHQVHHADLDVDVTTGTRFHPVEILISALYKAAVVFLFGIDPWVVVVFEALLNASAIFTHGNFALPTRLDRLLRRVICTPDMHRIHHSTDPRETDSNYGFFLAIWDHLFATFTPDPAKGRDGLVLGLEEKRDPSKLRLIGLLAMPFRKIQ